MNPTVWLIRAVAIIATGLAVHFLVGYTGLNPLINEGGKWWQLVVAAPLLLTGTILLGYHESSSRKDGRS